MWRSRRPKGRSSSCQSELRWNRTGVEAAVRHRSGEASKHQRGRATGRRTKQRSRQSCAASRGNNTKNETKFARFWGTRQEVPTRRWLALHDRDWPRFRDRSQHVFYVLIVRFMMRGQGLCLPLIGVFMRRHLPDPRDTYADHKVRARHLGIVWVFVLVDACRRLYSVAPSGAPVRGSKTPP